MGDVVNLNHSRKAKARASKDATATATANRTAFGRTKAEKVAQDLDGSRRNALLDGAQRSER